MRTAKIFLWCMLAMIVFASCGSNVVESRGEATVEEEIIEMNWNRAVKDLYWLDGLPEEQVLEARKISSEKH